MSGLTTVSAGRTLRSCRSTWPLSPGRLHRSAADRWRWNRWSVNLDAQTSRRHLGRAGRSRCVRVRRSRSHGNRWKRRQMSQPPSNRRAEALESGLGCAADGRAHSILDIPLRLPSRAHIRCRANPAPSRIQNIRRVNPSRRSRSPKQPRTPANSIRDSPLSCRTPHPPEGDCVVRRGSSRPPPKQVRRPLHGSLQPLTRK